jgi:putative serine protease PepD
MDDHTEPPATPPETGDETVTSPGAGSPLPPPVLPPPVPPASMAASPPWPLAPDETASAAPIGPTGTEPVLPAAPIWGGDTAPGPTGSAPAGGSSPPARRPWLGVVAVAALIGAAVGAGVTALTDNSGSSSPNVTIHESTAAPGAAVLNGGVTIPQLVKAVTPAVVSIDVKSGGSEDQGTGMIITSNGEVVTNNHVIELYTDGADSGTITVTEYGQSKPVAATLVGYDTTQDVALLKISNASDLHTVTFGNSAKAVVGDAVVAIGNALGLSAGTPTVTQGIVSALGRSVSAGGDGTATESLQNLIQTDAAINPGNSGGPLIDTAGQVIGMNTAVAGTADDGTSAQNIGFAIPIAQVEALIPQLLRGGAGTGGGGYLGVDITTLTSSLREQYGFTPTSGAVVLDVLSGSPADKAGLVQGDVIVDIDGTAITSAESLHNVIAKDKPGQKIAVSYYVGDNKHTTSVTLGDQAQAQKEQAEQQQSSSGSLGGGGFPGLGGD